jgi:hypothetical protein
MTSTVEFPASSDVPGKSTTSIVSRFSVSLQSSRAKALELISLCYGDLDDIDADATVPEDVWFKSIERIYDPNAGELNAF